MRCPPDRIADPRHVPAGPRTRRRQSTRQFPEYWRALNLTVYTGWRIDLPRYGVLLNSGRVRTRLENGKLLLDDPKVKKTFSDGGMDEFGLSEETPEAADALLNKEIKLWGDVIRANKIAAE